MNHDFVMLDEELGMVGASPAFLDAVAAARRFADSPLPILIVGETGTGKEILAHYIHRLSGRKGAFIDVDGGGLPDGLTDSILFGHRKGAFTGAHEASTGLLEQARGGTLFLDELASLTATAQSKLMRVLETGEVRRLGGRKVPVDFRIVSAVQGDIRDLVRGGKFRYDLLQRLGGAVVHVPPLSERVEDVVALARHYVSALGKRLTGGALTALIRSEWPGNVRELRWTIQRAVVLSEGGEIDAAVLARAMETGASALLDSQQEADEPDELSETCRSLEGDPTLISEALDVSRATLYRRLGERGLRLEDFRNRGASDGGDASVSSSQEP